MLSIYLKLRSVCYNYVELSKTPQQKQIRGHTDIKWDPDPDIGQF